MFWAELCKISQFFIWKFSVFGGDIFYIFESVCYHNAQNDKIKLHNCRKLRTKNFNTGTSLERSADRLPSFRHHSERRFFRLEFYLNFCSDWPYLIRNHLSFFTLILNLLRKMGVTYAISIVQWILGIFISENILAHLSRRLRWAIVITPRPSSVRLSVRSHFWTTSPLKSLGQISSNFMWSLVLKGDWKFVKLVTVRNAHI